jgi:DNA-binding MarR family transcriptional regulator
MGVGEGGIGRARAAGMSLDAVFFSMKRAHLGGQRLGRFLLEPFEKFGVTPARFDMMKTIFECEEMLSQAKLVRRLGVVRSAVSDMVKVLVELKLLKKFRAADGRTFIVQLTEFGRALIKKACDELLNNGEATAYVDNVITNDFNRDPMSRRHDWTAWFFHIGKKLGNNAIANRDLYVWDMEDLYAAVIRPEDGETWGRVPWMDEKWIAENSFEIPSGFEMPS